MKEIYKKVYRRNNFSFISKGKEYTARIINVTFKYSNKIYNRIRNGLYIKSGYSFDEIEFDDCVCVRNHELIGIKVDEPVKQELEKDILGKYFYYHDGVYKAKSNIKPLNSVANIREHLYEDGFICDGIKYVRFKRTGGSSRVGKCLFIDEKLYKAINKWGSCGIEIRNGQEIELAEWESYISLTLSSIIDTIEIKAENILVIDDYISIFKDKAIATDFINGKLVTKTGEFEISNNIWDGQSLLDISMFSKYSQYGMLLLRNRFFKSCCFNANIQKWFKDHNITDISQLNGHTKAKAVKDIKLITTPSSIKYLKFGALDDWLWTLESTFGIVKHDKPTYNFDGRMVRCHYQLLNTIQLTYDEVGRLIQPTLNYLKLLKTSPAVLRNHIEYQDNCSDENDKLSTKYGITYKLLGITDKFANTELYQKFRDDLIRSLVKEIRKGHILVNGNYSTLCGNPIEMLKASIGHFKGVSELGKGNIHCTFFSDNETVLGSRSPHIAAGNMLITKNTINVDISKYLNPSKEIVYINSIEENILERLSGSDFDADSLLLTNNSLLINGAKRNYENFLVPTKLVKPKKRKRKYTPTDLADLDIKTSVNRIGEIVNLSQELNSKYWTALNNGESMENLMDIYTDIAQLDVMSNLEIDSAKRENPADNVKELKIIKQKYEKRDKNNRYIRPAFYRHIERDKGYYNPNKKAYIYHDTTMDYLQQHVNKFRFTKNKNNQLLKFSDLFISKSDVEGQVWYVQVKNIVDLIRDMRSDIKGVWNSESDIDIEEKHLRTKMIKEECSKVIGTMSIGNATMLHLLGLIEKDEYSDISRSLLNILFGYPNSSFYKLINDSKEPLCNLVECDNGNIQLYDIRYKMEVADNT